jgi:tRNA pseudouridine55 synthase
MFPDGLVNLNKPAGMTSRQAVDRVGRLTRPQRAGHAGTLDPLATGVLVVCVGAATRLIEYVQRMPKRYTGTFLLGRRSPTEDVEGNLFELPDAPIPTLEQIRAAAGRLVGRIQQRPPAFSALKIKGQPAYKLARQGRAVELAARPVEIHRIEIVAYRYPELTLDVVCGSGTYIRSLGRDLAESLGTAAVMSALRRTAIGRFTIDEAIDPHKLSRDNLPRFLQPPLVAVEALPRVQLTADEAMRIRHGLTVVRREKPLVASQESAEIVAVDPTGELIGILSLDAAGQLRTLRNMPT